MGEALLCALLGAASPGTDASSVLPLCPALSTLLSSSGHLSQTIGQHTCYPKRDSHSFLTFPFPHHPIPLHPLWGKNSKNESHHLHYLFHFSGSPLPQVFTPSPKTAEVRMISQADPRMGTVNRLCSDHPSILHKLPTFLPSQGTPPGLWGQNPSFSQLQSAELLGSLALHLSHPPVSSTHWPPNPPNLLNLKLDMTSLDGGQIGDTNMPNVNPMLFTSTCFSPLFSTPLLKVKPSSHP